MPLAQLYANRRYVLVVLMLAYALNFIDRQLLVIVQESVKKELDLTDTQLGLLTGFAFAMFYVTLGIPIARFSDQSNRKNVIAVCLALWSTVTALTGLALNFMHLLIARIGVGIGEAGCAPQSHAIISDYYGPRERGTALSIFSLGIYIGIFVAYLGGGFLNQYYGWRVAFFAMGLPGIAVALVLFLSVKEPVRGASDQSESIRDLSFWNVIAFLFKRRTFIFIFLGVGFTAFVLYGIGNWFPSFLTRYFGLSSKEIGIANAFVIGIGGAIGTFAGGFIGDKLGRKSVKWYLLTPMITGLLSVPFALIALFSSHLWLVLTCIFIGVVCITMYLAPSIAVGHMLVAANTRSTTSSVLFFGLNLIGLGGGPLMAGVLSDVMQSEYHEQSLRISMAITVCAGLVAALFYFLASRSLSNDLKELHRQ